ncbi:type IV pilus modification protein PilV, partial [mine drainage metagenome]
MNVCLSTRARCGFSLVEVLVAVLIFSLGLLGLAGLLVVSTQSSHASYLRTQVGFMAEQMANRMRANPQGVWAGSYDSAAYPIAGAPPACDSA